jgi:hypothetical protein
MFAPLQAYPADATMADRLAATAGRTVGGVTRRPNAAPTWPPDYSGRWATTADIETVLQHCPHRTEWYVALLARSEALVGDVVYPWRLCGTGTVPVLTVIRSTKVEPDSVPAASPRLPRSTSPWSPGQPLNANPGVPRPTADGYAPLPAHIHQVEPVRS